MNNQNYCFLIHLSKNKLTNNIPINNVIKVWSPLLLQKNESIEMRELLYEDNFENFLNYFESIKYYYLHGQPYFHHYPKISLCKISNLDGKSNIIQSKDSLISIIQNRWKNYYSKKVYRIKFLIYYILKNKLDSYLILYLYHYI